MMIKANQCRTPETPKSFKTLPILKVVLDDVLANSNNQMVKKDSKGLLFYKETLLQIIKNIFASFNFFFFIT